jgi:hypothetical protein
MIKISGLLSVLLLTASLWANGTFATGDVLISLSDGSIQWRDPAGTLKTTLTSDIRGQAKGMAFDASGNLYVAYWWTEDRSSGNTVGKFGPDGTFLGQFGSSYFCNPTSLAFDRAGNMYVGQTDCDADILKFNSSGALMASFDVAAQNSGYYFLLVGRPFDKAVQRLHQYTTRRLQSRVAA